MSRTPAIRTKDMSQGNPLGLIPETLFPEISGA